MTCSFCHGSGEDELGYLSCAHCDAAVKRTALNEAVKKLGPIHADDLVWFGYQTAVTAMRAEIEAKDRKIEELEAELDVMCSRM